MFNCLLIGVNSTRKDFIAATDQGLQCLHKSKATATMLADKTKTLVSALYIGFEETSSYWSVQIVNLFICFSLVTINMTPVSFVKTTEPYKVCG